MKATLEHDTNTTETFAFDHQNQKRADAILKRYPEHRKQSAVLPLLDLAQRQCGGWLPQYAMDAVANMLGLAKIRVYEVASFYTMFNLKPVGKHLIQICRTTPCWLRGSDDLVSHCRSRLGIDLGQTTQDGQFTLMEVECLGACVNAPAVQINDNYYEDLDPRLLEDILTRLEAEQSPVVGSQIGRQGSAPEKGAQTLLISTDLDEDQDQKTKNRTKVKRNSVSNTKA